MNSPPPWVPMGQRDPLGWGRAMLRLILLDWRSNGQLLGISRQKLGSGEELGKRLVGGTPLVRCRRGHRLPPRHLQRIHHRCLRGCRPQGHRPLHRRRIFWTVVGPRNI